VVGVGRRAGARRRVPAQRGRATPRAGPGPALPGGGGGAGRTHRLRWILRAASTAAGSASAKSPPSPAGEGGRGSAAAAAPWDGVGRGVGRRQWGPQGGGGGWVRYGAARSALVGGPAAKAAGEGGSRNKVPGQRYASGAAPASQPHLCRVGDVGGDHGLELHRVHMVRKRLGWGWGWGWGGVGVSGGYIGGWGR
jgi:hypothetical protein